LVPAVFAPLAPANPHWARVVGYGLFLWVIHKEGLCSSSGDINMLMMMMIDADDVDTHKVLSADLA
jgi:hypothetical protein